MKNMEFFLLDICQTHQEIIPTSLCCSNDCGGKQFIYKIPISQNVGAVL